MSVSNTSEDTFSGQTSMILGIQSLRFLSSHRTTVLIKTRTSTLSESKSNSPTFLKVITWQINPNNGTVDMCHKVVSDCSIQLDVIQS